MKHIGIILLLIVTTIEVSYSQDPQFSQFYAAPLYHCPSFAGSTDGSRVAAIYRNQWAALPSSFVSYACSFDHYFYKKNSGVGMLLLRDQAGSGGLSLNSASVMYSYNITNRKRMSFRPGLAFSVSNRGLDYSKLIFKDMMLNQSSTSLYEAPTERKTYMDASASFAFFSYRSWAGLTLDHLLVPNQSVTGETSRVPVKYSLFGGIKLTRSKFIKYKEKNATLAFLYKGQQKFDQLDLGFYYRYYPVVFGFWYRGLLIKPYEIGYANNDALVLLFGIKMQDLYFAYSYDITISGLYRDSGGSHEISLIMEFNQDQKSKKKKWYMIVPCPKW